jgi:hypothetical protein
VSIYRVRAEKLRRISKRTRSGSVDFQKEKEKVMALTITTLFNGNGAGDTLIGLTSVAGVGSPNSATGGGFTYLYCGNEMMQVGVGPRDTHWVPNIIRGVNGTIAAAHVTGESVLIGGPADFTNFQPTQANTVGSNNRFAGFSPSVASATTITATGDRFHVTGTTPTATINLPPNFVEGSITVTADAVWTWTAAGNIAAAGTVTTAGTSVVFNYDAATGKWSPSRVA